MLTLCLDKQARAFETVDVKSGVKAQVKCAGKEEDLVAWLTCAVRSFGNENGDRKGDTKM